MKKRYPCELQSLSTDNGALAFALSISPRRRTILIRVEKEIRHFPQGSSQVSVVAPRRVAPEEIHSFIRKNIDWINRKIEQVKTARLKLNERQFAAGSQFLFLGKPYPVQVEMLSRGRSRIIFEEESWQVKLSKTLPVEKHSAEIGKKLVTWYQDQAKEILGSRLLHYARIMNEKPLAITIRSQKSIWGSCHHRKKAISLNWRLILAPLAVVDYVIVHELSHLKVPNHSQRFWRRVEEFMPDFRDHKKWLRLNHFEMELPKYSH